MTGPLVQLPALPRRPWPNPPQAPAALRLLRPARFPPEGRRAQVCGPVRPCAHCSSVSVAEDLAPFLYGTVGQWT